ncbi:MAG TPA: hypothetical protein DCL43_02655 [Chitinophagaceae bacterium]|nr:hypothetical protein [Chitinophagaceae bacterium]HAN39115.1 hypothetical protein [Chitinophagaceae bacterium]
MQSPFFNYYQFEMPQVVVGDLLDEKLAAGWYRIGALMMTTDLIDIPNGYAPVFWLRYMLQRTKFSKSIAKLVAKNDQLFTVRVVPAYVKPEYEELYEKYRNFIDFSISPSLYESLYNSSPFNFFETVALEIRCNKQLAAVGFMDIGNKASAGILNIYDPTFKKYSLGKYAIAKKITWSQERNLQLFYPGYISTHVAKFNYKTAFDPSSCEVLLPNTRTWEPFTTYDYTALRQLYEQLLTQHNNAMPSE